MDFLASAVVELVIEREAMRADLAKVERAISVLAATANAKPPAPPQGDQHA